MGHTLFATDLDGTLLDTSGAVHETDRRALVELARRGAALTIVTGRMYANTRDVARLIGIDGPVCCVDGSAIVSVAADRHLVTRSIGADACAALRATLGASTAAVFVLCEDEVLHDRTGDPFVPYLTGWSPRVRRIDAVCDMLGDAEVSALIAVGEEPAIKTMAADIARDTAGAVEPTTWAVRREEWRGRWALIARAAGATKGTALAWIAAHHGIDLRDVVAVGDWHNDVPMFRVAGRSFAMGHAPDEVKAAATHSLRADATTGGGVAEAAERAGLL